MNPLREGFRDGWAGRASNAMKTISAVIAGAIVGAVLGVVVGIIVPNQILEPGIAPLVGLFTGAALFWYLRRSGRMFQ